MATKTEYIENERKQFNHIRKHIKSIRGMCDATIDAMLDKGMIQVSTAFEHAVADEGGYNVVSEDGRDFDDCQNSDAKLCTVRYSGKLGTYSAPVSSIHNKRGALRVGVLEPINDKMYYFHIPRYAYEHIGNSSNIEIPFDKGGLPRRNNNCSTNWWVYEEDTFQDMAKHSRDPVLRRMDQTNRLFSQLNHTGGKVKGQLSMTANAIRKRERRALAKQAVRLA